MDAKTKSQWTVEERTCLLGFWSSAEVQKKLEGATRTKVVFEQLQREMAAAGYDRSAEQIINKLKKSKKDFRDQKKDLGRSGNGRPKKGPHFDVIDSVLGDRPACQITGALNSATAMLESMVDESLIESTPDIGKLHFSNVSLRLPTTYSCTLLCVLAVTYRKRKRDKDSELLQYLERSDERHLQSLEASRVVTNNLLEQISASNTALLGLMGRVVTVMEAGQK
ncbi:uncharacterized protein LOC132469549 [Gadus macrocephalus]|uniref:uncharacterized protein LOC132469549 n=1 Tax=Gadus macrocephalus TaxID=80720 RepID=UPI0028CB97C9|nr:uncharacterized protein LOC132469549 [Gadus macrocephalus]